MHEHESEGSAHSRSHLLIMVLGCLIPIILIGAAAAANINNQYLPFLIVLLCPLMMILMHLSSALSKQKKTEET